LSSGYRKYYDKDKEVSIDYPSDWTVDEKIGDSNHWTLTFQAPEESGSGTFSEDRDDSNEFEADSEAFEMFSVERNPPDKSFDELHAVALIGSEVIENESEPNTTFKGRKARIQVYRHTTRVGGKSKRLYIDNGNAKYTLTYRASLGRYRASTERDIRESFEIL
jgi:hypothetical protein